MHTQTNPQTRQSQEEGDQKLGHELANILTPVIGISELLMHRAGDSDDPEISRLAKALRDSATAARDLVQRVREIQALEHGRRTLTPRTGNLTQLLRSTVRSVADTPTAKDVRIESSYDVDDAQVEMDYDLLPRVFRAIIQNAVEHVSSEPDLDERIVHVCLTTELGDYVVQISNPGTPVPAEKIDSFFDKFNSDRRRKPSGVGLGTTYARLVTCAHGGRIGVRRSIEDGTVVTIALPKAIG
ncbi:MAG: HAMP domain-containing histidine kinase [Spirochaetales bacterium]|nr:HAMP domain-containing histidine kinase [Spirochaetales bacterium]